MVDMIPSIDLGLYLKGSARDRRNAVDGVSQVMGETGFFFVTGHGLATDLIEKTRRTALDFFNKPLAAKLLSSHPSGSLNRGYTPYAGESNANSSGRGSVADMREGFIFGPFDRPQDLPESNMSLYAYEPNIWPTEFNEMAAVMEEYYRHLAELNKTLLSIFANVLGLETSFFEQMFDRHSSTVRLLHYPPQTSKPADGQLRCGAHTDFGIHTILLADNAPTGLQVCDNTERWIDVVPPPNSFVINIGDMMKMWTNDRWASTLHRVRNPIEDECTKSRLSIAFFTYPNPDAIIKCLPTCCSPENPPHHPSVVAGEYRRTKINAITTETLGVS